MKSIKILTEQDRNHLISYAKVMPLGQFSAQFVSIKNKRSISQNKLFWMWVTVIGQDLGYTPIEMHDYIVETLCPKTTLEVLGKVITRSLGTSELGVKEFAVLLDMMETWAGTTFGIRLPQPKDEYYEAMGWKEKSNVQE